MVFAGLGRFLSSSPVWSAMSSGPFPALPLSSLWAALLGQISLCARPPAFARSFFAPLPSPSLAPRPLLPWPVGPWPWSALWRPLLLPSWSPSPPPPARPRSSRPPPPPRASVGGGPAPGRLWRWLPASASPFGFSCVSPLALLSRCRRGGVAPGWRVARQGCPGSGFRAGCGCPRSFRFSSSSGFLPREELAWRKSRQARATAASSKPAASWLAKSKNFSRSCRIARSGRGERAQKDVAISFLGNLSLVGAFRPLRPMRHLWGHRAPQGQHLLLLPRLRRLRPAQGLKQNRPPRLCDQPRGAKKGKEKRKRVRSSTPKQGERICRSKDQR